MNDSFIGNPTKAGTAGGVLTIFLINITGGDILRTMLMACIGAVVSFMVSVFLRFLFRRWKR